MAGKEFAPVKKISFYDRNGNIIEDSNEDSNKDSNSEEQQVLEFDPNSESYIDEPENHPGWLREIPTKVEADPEPETEAIKLNYISFKLNFKKIT